jgi:hypothetical protein
LRRRFTRLPWVLANQGLRFCHETDNIIGS